jgi:hypothetical protein
MERPNSSAAYFEESTAKLFDKHASRCQIGKAPAIITLPVSANGAPKSGRDLAQSVKTDSPAAQFDSQSIRSDRHRGAPNLK